MSEKTSKEHLKKSDYDEISEVIDHQIERIASIAGAEHGVENLPTKQKKRWWRLKKICEGNGV